ncbi:PREDICTED: borealin [Gavialis gangeticus]|uniref:borealin n=1 Tax=Gavialis gangeticus TaxID=94835 RepID=UPI00092FA49F|nr:PREDICTED: borealin [Gavialis gangeticus]
MAPSRSRQNGGARRRKLAAFLKDFDREVKSRLDRVQADGQSLIKELEKLYDIELLRLPVALREMNWLGYFAKGGSKKALEEAATADVEISEINKITAKVIQTPFKTIKKAGKSKKDIGAFEETEFCLLPASKKSRQESQALEEPKSENTQPRTEKVKAATKRPPSRSRRCPSAKVKAANKRTSKSNYSTPAVGRALEACTQGGTSVVLSRFDSRIFKTPGLRTPAVNEPVFIVSKNGSPLANTNDVIITVPLKGGEALRFTASELTKRNLHQLNPEALGVMKNLSVRLAQVCGSTKT